VLNNRWGRRPDKGLSDALRGLDDRHTLYNYRLGAAHVLVAPSGVYVFQPKYQFGPVTYEGGRWKNPGARGSLFNFFSRDTIGNPVAESGAEVDALKRFLKKHLPEAEVEPRPVAVFMHPRAVVSADEAPVTALHVKQLKDYVRRQPKSATLPLGALTSLEDKLGFASVKEAS
jgi:hypothetical protein